MKRFDPKMILETLAEKGEPLCKAICDRLQGKGHTKASYYVLLGSQESKEMLGKIATRQMTREEYLQYLGGELPFSKSVFDKEYFLDSEEARKVAKDISDSHELNNIGCKI
jgi:hypothetical protein